jgi:hypothetical protein
MKLLIVLLLSTNCFAFSMKSYEKKTRPFVERYLGVNIANSVFGRKEKGIEMPPIPKLVKEKVKKFVPSLVLQTQGAKYKNLSNLDKRKYRLAFLDELFMSTRRTKATNDDFGIWLNTLEQGSSREGIYRALVLDQVYYQLENFDDPTNKKVITFATKIMAKFIGEKANQKAMSKLNTYIIKRIVTSKLLDMIEMLQVNEKDVHRWYAVLSADFGNEFDFVFKNKVRQNKDSKVHFEWVKQVPLDHIKTETAIKTHKIFNHLMN